MECEIKAYRVNSILVLIQMFLVRVILHHVTGPIREVVILESSILGLQLIATIDAQMQCVQPSLQQQG